MLKYFLLILIVLVIYTQGLVPKESCPPEIVEFEDNPAKSNMWLLINQGNFGEVEKILAENPCLVHMRSRDHRGPLFWAYEFGRNDIVSLLLAKGADPSDRDDSGNIASDMSPSVNVNFKPSQGK